MNEYKISRFDNSTIENLTKEEVVEDLKKILSEDSDDFQKTEVYDPKSGWSYASEWLKEQNIELGVYGY